MVRVSMFVSGAITLCWLAFTTFPWLMFYCVIFGFFGGGFISLTASVCAEMYGIGHLATVMGLMTTSLTFGFLLATPIAGWLFLVQDSYTIPIIVAGGCMVAGSVIIDFMADRQPVVRLRSHTVTLHHDQAQESYVQRKHSTADRTPHVNVSLVGALHRCLRMARLRAPTFLEDDPEMSGVDKDVETGSATYKAVTDDDMTPSLLDEEGSTAVELVATSSEATETKL